MSAFSKDLAISSMEPTNDSGAYQRQVDISLRSRQRIDRQAIATRADTNDRSLMRGLRSYMLAFLNQTPQRPLPQTILAIHDYWYLIFRISTTIDRLHAEQDTLAAEVIRVRELGLLQNTDGYIVTEDGRVWADLPYLVRDLQSFWLENGDQLTNEEQANFTAFVGRLMGQGVRALDFGAFVLSLLDACLAQERAGKSPEIKPDRVIMKMAQEQKINLAYSLLFYAGHRLATFSRTASSGLESFSVEKWTFWHDTVHSAYLGAGEAEKSRELAKATYNVMCTWSKHLAIPSKHEKIVDMA